MPAAVRGARYRSQSIIFAAALLKTGSPVVRAAKSRASPAAAGSVTAVRFPITPSLPSASWRTTASFASRTTSSVSPDSRKLCAATPCSQEYLCMASRAFLTFWRRSAAGERRSTARELRSGASEAIVPYHLFVPVSARLDDPFLCGKVRIRKPEPLGEPVRPFEVVHQRPDVVAADVHAFLDGPVDAGKVPVEEVNPVLVHYLPLPVDHVPVGHAVLRDDDPDARVVLAQANEQVVAVFPPAALDLVGGGGGAPEEPLGKCQLFHGVRILPHRQSARYGAAALFRQKRAVRAGTNCSRSSVRTQPRKIPAMTS